VTAIFVDGVGLGERDRDSLLPLPRRFREGEEPFLGELKVFFRMSLPNKEGTNRESPEEEEGEADFDFDRDRDGEREDEGERDDRFFRGEVFLGRDSTRS